MSQGGVVKVMTGESIETADLNLWEFTDSGLSARQSAGN